jgi:hypothetical protein
MAGFGIPEMMMAQTALSGAGLIHGIASSSAAASQAEAQARAQSQAMRAQAERQREMLDRQYASETRRRTNLLERATAKARVSFGARGLSPTDGSAGALLDGIETDFGIDEAQRTQDYDMRRSALDAGLADSLQRIDFATSRNLLEHESDIQRRVLGLLSWGARGLGRGGGGGGLPRGPVGDFPVYSGLYDNLA